MHYYENITDVSTCSSNKYHLLVLSNIKGEEGTTECDKARKEKIHMKNNCFNWRL